MSAVAPADSTVVAIRKKIRRLTASASESSLTTASIDQYINTFYTQDFPYGIKIDQMRSVYVFYTEPYRDRYPLDVYYNQGVRAPMYVDGIIGSFTKDRQQFFNVWPKFPSTQMQSGESVSGTITGIAQPTNPTQITSVNHNLTTGAVILITDVVGMTQLNDFYFTITVVNANQFTLNGIDNTTYGAYVSGGTWETVSQTFSFTIPAPFLSREVSIGGVNTNGSPITINDDGNGNIQLITPNPVVSVPAQNTSPAVPGMYNLNTSDPGLKNVVNIGEVNYVTGEFDFTLPAGISLALGTQFTIRVSQYQTGRPYSLLFWNNEFSIRPVPKHIHKVEIETFLTPVQFMLTTDLPILNQWWQLIAIGAAIKVLEDRQDMDGVQNLSILYDRQEDLVLERQGVEEIFQPNQTMFNSSNTAYGGIGGIGYW